MLVRTLSCSESAVATTNVVVVLACYVLFLELLELLAAQWVESALLEGSVGSAQICQDYLVKSLPL